MRIILFILALFLFMASAFFFYTVTLGAYMAGMSQVNVGFILTITAMLAMVGAIAFFARAIDR